MYLVSEYTVVDLFCVIACITFRKFSLYFYLFFRTKKLHLFFTLVCFQVELNLPIHGRQKQLKQYFCFKDCGFVHVKTAYMYIPVFKFKPNRFLQSFLGKTW